MDNKCGIVTAEHCYLRQAQGVNEMENETGIEDEIFSGWAVRAVSEEENGWVNLASVGGSLAKRVPGFDSRNYGYKKLKNFVESSDCFDIYETTNPKNELLKIVYIKVK